MQSRYYDCNTCKFINIDDPSILLADPYNVQCVHIYDYCGFNPVNSTDKTGKTSHKVNNKHKYDRSKVVKYINKWVYSYNKEFIKCTYDCTNFVSQCLYVGGFPMNYYWQCTQRSKSFYYITGIRFYATDSWIYANDLFYHIQTYMARYKRYRIKNNNDLKKYIRYLDAGDLIFFHTEKKDKYNHAAIIRSIVNGKVNYAQHQPGAFRELTSRIKNANKYGWVKGWFIDIIHIDTYADWRY